MPRKRTSPSASTIPLFDTMTEAGGGFRVALSGRGDWRGFILFSHLGLGFESYACLASIWFACFSHAFFILATLTSDKKQRATHKDEPTIAIRAAFGSPDRLAVLKRTGRQRKAAPST